MGRDTGGAADPDPRRQIPRTDVLLADPRLVDAALALGPAAVRRAVTDAQQAARAGRIAPDDVAELAVASLPRAIGSLRPVLNATGVVLHTNLGRAPLSPAAVDAVARAAGYVDVELDLATGRRARRGAAAMATLAAALPEAGAVHVVGNGAAALVLAATALVACREIVVSRGELVEIGDGFRLSELLTSTGARLREVGTTNRTTLADYEQALGPDTGFVLKVHPSNFVVTGFTASVDVAALATLDATVVVDTGSGLLRADPLLPDEPHLAGALSDGADLVTSSGDKLLGGPQAGLLAGRSELVEQLRRHPLARALRVDKLTLAALEATVAGPPTPTWAALHADPADLDRRTRRIAQALDLPVVDSEGLVGGGGAPGLRLPGCALALPAALAPLLRAGDPPVLARVDHDRCLVDLRCIPAADDERLLTALRAATA